MLQIYSVEIYSVGWRVSFKETFTVCTYASLTARSLSTLVTPQCNRTMSLCNISTPLARKGSHEENKASHGRKYRFILNFVVFYCTWFRKPNFCIQAMPKQYQDVCFLGDEGGMRRSQNCFLNGKKNGIRYFARFNFSCLSLAFILKYYPILHVVKR